MRGRACPERGARTHLYDLTDRRIDGSDVSAQNNPVVRALKEQAEVLAQQSARIPPPRSRLSPGYQ
jgi:hypothetical protein